ncbi:Rrf2 family transcriptional regulator [Paenibacillus filicis]|uniref:Rrf2 family transcriptional regulator n=1 Tax=Paenibacillus filicis TaxID=669464 RepID=A0ABU9DS26_9BACL
MGSELAGRRPVRKGAPSKTLRFCRGVYFFNDEERTMTDSISSTRWFGLALQILLILADHNELCPSGKIAEKMKSRPSFLRKILTHLVKAEIIQAKEGREGGYTLVKDPKDISLMEVYEAIKAEPLTKGFICMENTACRTPSIESGLLELRDEIEGWITDGLRKKTLADLLNK